MKRLVNLRPAPSPAEGKSDGGQAPFNPLITLKALSYFDDVSALPTEVRERLRAAVEAIDPTRLPVLTPHVPRAADRRRTP
jgi:hypothetical protein